MTSLATTVPQVQQAAIFSYVNDMANAINALGSKLTQLAVYNTEIERLAEIMRIMHLNSDSPGAFADYITSVKVEDAQGKKQVIVRAGKIKNGIERWSEACPDLMKGWKRKDMAKAFGMIPTDKRLDDIARGMRRACQRLGLEVGWHKGRFKVLTVREVSVKLDQQKENVKGQLMSREYMAGTLEVRGLMPKETQEMQVPLYEVLGEDDNGYRLN